MATLCTDRRAPAVRRIRVATIVISGLMLALCGCASPGPQGAAPVAVDMPAAWSVTDVSVPTGTTSLVEWWSRFDDPLLATLVAQAMQSNTSVNTAQAALQQARGLRDVSAAALWPDVGVSASAGRSKSGHNSAVNNFTVGLDASWEVDVFGVNRNALKASEATAEASAASLGDV
jgi:multidrug efflux system outer membrane protein